MLDGGIFIFGQGSFQLTSGDGPFQFIDSANVERARLNAGTLQLDGDLDVDGNNITFGNPGASDRGDSIDVHRHGRGRRLGRPDPESREYGYR